MKWGVHHVKVTLENESGETVVIEQSPDGRVKCEPGKAGKSERAANTPPSPKAAESRTEAKTAAAPKAAKPKESARAESTPKAEEKPKARAQPAKPRGKGSRKGPLKWVPVKDHEYDGFAAASGGGQFKALIAKNTQWALFYELKGVWPKNIGCFRKVDKAKERAQELHDAGWPETEFGPITAGQIARACPAPGGQEDEEMETTPKAEEKPAEPRPEPKGEAKTDAERDKELMGSFSSELDSVLDEDEDD